MTENKNRIAVDKDFMNIVHQAFMIFAHMVDDWEEFFPALHEVWDRYAQEIFPYELCQHMDDMKELLSELEKLANVKISQVVSSAIEGEA